MLFKKEKMQAHTTVLIGTYMIIRGLSFFLGEYPNETQIFSKINESKIEAFSSVYIYILLFLALYAIGTIVQNKINKNLN